MCLLLLWRWSLESPFSSRLFLVEAKQGRLGLVLVAIILAICSTLSSSPQKLRISRFLCGTSTLGCIQSFHLQHLDKRSFFSPKETFECVNRRMLWPICLCSSFIRLHSAPVTIRFVTNTTKECKRDLLERLTKLGFDIAENEIFTSLTAARNLLEQRQVRPLLLVDDKALPDFTGEVVRKQHGGCYWTTKET